MSRVAMIAAVMSALSLLTAACGETPGTRALTGGAIGAAGGAAVGAAAARQSGGRRRRWRSGRRRRRCRDHAAAQLLLLIRVLKRIPGGQFRPTGMCFRMPA
jgi:Flp pilus assembly protein TadD